jgi:hypothetical protein
MSKHIARFIRVHRNEDADRLQYRVDQFPTSDTAASSAFAMLGHMIRASWVSNLLLERQSCQSEAQE